MGRRDQTVIDSLARRRVRVNDNHDNAYEGLLWAADESGVLVHGAGPDPVVWRFRDADTGELKRQDVVGQMFVPTVNLSSIQVLD